MNETLNNLNSVERIKRVVNLKEPDHVPFAPQMWYFQPRIYGITYEDFIFDPIKGEECSKAIFEKFGGFDLYLEGTLGTMYFTDNPYNPSVFSVFWHDWKLPGIDFPVNALPQFSEMARITEKDYRVIAENGLNQFRFRTKKEVETFYKINVDQLFAKTGKTKEDTKEWLKEKTH